MSLLDDGLAVLTGAALVGLGALALSQRADAETGYIVTSAHGVVRTSTLPHCANDGYEKQPVMPCTWNVGYPLDGDGYGIAYILTDHDDGVRIDYVWRYNPVRNGWHWERTGDGPSDCVVKAGKHYERCAAGNFPIPHRSAS